MCSPLSSFDLWISDGTWQHSYCKHECLSDCMKVSDSITSGQLRVQVERTLMPPDCVPRSHQPNPIQRWSGTHVGSFVLLCEHEHIPGHMKNRLLSGRPLTSYSSEFKLLCIHTWICLRPPSHINTDQNIMTDTFLIIMFNTFLLSYWAFVDKIDIHFLISCLWRYMYLSSA